MGDVPVETYFGRLIVDRTILPKEDDNPIKFKTLELDVFFDVIFTNYRIPRPKKLDELRYLLCYTFPPKQDCILVHRL